MLCGFDWLWCSRGFWNATINPKLITIIPGIDIQGQRYPFSICFVCALGFGMVPLLASKAHDRIGRALGVLHIPVILLAGALIDWIVETICTHDLQVWTYHQAPQHLLRDVVWSNTWFMGGPLALAYFGLARVPKWTAIEDGAGPSLASEQTWKSLLMASATTLTPALLLATAQLFLVVGYPALGRVGPLVLNPVTQLLAALP
jgi:hypothetical protein